MTWVQAILAAITLAREIVKYLNEKTKCKKETRQKLKQMRSALKDMKKTGRTDHVEDMFRALGFPADGLQDKS